VVVSLMPYTPDEAGRRSVDLNEKVAAYVRQSLEKDPKK
jgi:hypothetical protein